MCQGFSNLKGFLHHFVLAKLATSSIRITILSNYMLDMHSSSGVPSNTIQACPITVLKSWSTGTSGSLGWRCATISLNIVIPGGGGGGGGTSVFRGVHTLVINI